jgi:FkbM family methyltransferase
MNKVANFVVIDTNEGKMIINRHDIYHVNCWKEARSSIEDEVKKLFPIIDSFTKNCIVVDAGAHLGMYTIPIAKRILSKKGKVISFEPQKMFYYSLCGSLALNDIDNVEAHQKALGDSFSKITLTPVNYSDPNNFGGISGKGNNEGGEVVEVVTIDNLNLERLDLLKIDVENMEFEVLDGAIETIKKYKPVIVLEYIHAGQQSIIDYFERHSLSYTYEVCQMNFIMVPK